jgi:ferredoxin hydrogenase large subunit
MENIFTNDSRQFKFDILVTICRMAQKSEITENDVWNCAQKLVSRDTPRIRCCIYKEREVLRQRVRLAMGQNATDAIDHRPTQIVQVIDAACDGCTIQKVRVTDNCRKCMAKKCMAACKFDAIHLGTYRSEIDYSKCKECGSCARACPYNAIVVTERPCYAHCPVQAISWDSHHISVIDESKCINCGQCEGACPFGAVEDKSWVLPVENNFRNKVPMYAIVAPSIQGQFDGTSLAQIIKAVEMIGFEKCYEVAGGADAVAVFEYEELKKRKAQGIPLTTSCCSAFINMMKIHFPEQYAKNKSSTLSPMLALARKLKTDHPDHQVVFIGPCIAKKSEVMEDRTCDYAITFEELAAMFVSRHINPQEVKADDMKDYASTYGRNFAHSGGVAAAVAQAAKEAGDPDSYSIVQADGGFECKKQLTLMKFGKFNADILEGMNCVGGCVNGPAVISDPVIVKGRMIKENMALDKKTIAQGVDVFDMKGFDIEIKDKPQ